MTWKKDNPTIAFSISKIQSLSDTVNSDGLSVCIVCYGSINILHHQLGKIFALLVKLFINEFISNTPYPGTSASAHNNAKKKDKKERMKKKNGSGQP